ncbi:Spo0E family sporulation regulatory protein-aspartic acid phosphatase [Bacillus songklensis]|uniref:Spo0E family sporulation regulatory protein-aspartic acid phosphatase n=1 Tax=Bacillus songklensis TaxID=1069116 RepID=A0ABV8B290_9BACI
MFFYGNRSEAEALLIEIVQKRQKMMMLAEEKGFTSMETIECSQELDELLNIYQQLLTKKEKRKGFFSFLAKPFVFQKLG